MDVTQIPFVNKVGISRNSKGVLELQADRSLRNHLETVHASAQFALAETASGEMLQNLFPELEGKVVPLLRDSRMKYRKPAKNGISAHPYVTEDEIAKFNKQYNHKGRATILVSVDIKDDEGAVASCAEFNWFVQSVDL